MNKQILGHGKKYLKNYMTGEFLFQSRLASTVWYSCEKGQCSVNGRAMIMAPHYLFLLLSAQPKKKKHRSCNPPLL